MQPGGHRFDPGILHIKFDRASGAVVVADAYQSIVGPTGRGITADIATFSHAEDAPLGGVHSCQDLPSAYHPQKRTLKLCSHNNLSFLS